ncbi:MAG: histidine phosphatase family protein [Thermoflexales bacterium]
MEQVQQNLSVPRRVWLIRHSQTEWNRSRRYLSDTDVLLNHFGERQAQAIARFFAARRVDAVVHSGLQRTEQIARAIAGARSISVQADWRWREVRHGRWEGLTYREVTQRFPDEAQRRFSNPLHAPIVGGESLAQIAERVGQAWQALAEQCAGLRVAVVTHATPIQLVLCRLFNVPPDQHWRWRVDLGSITALDCYPGGVILRCANWRPALDS